MNILLAEVLGPGLEQLLEKLGEDVAGPLKDQVIDSAKDMVKEGLDSGELPEATQEEKRETLVETLEAVIETQQKVLADYITNLISGRADTLGKFHEQIEDGKWLVDQLQVQNADLFSLTNAATAGFSALLLPTAWSLNQLQPIILVEDKDCDGGEPLGLMDGDATHAGGSCIVGGKTLFLVGYDNEQCTQTIFAGGAPSTQNVPCTQHVFRKLPAIDQLSNFGLNKDNIISSVYNQWLLNGQKNDATLNPGSTATDGSGNTGPFPFSAGFSTPGLFPGIPVCDMDTAKRNYQNAGPIKNAADLCS